ncbi:MarR family transcriptional regulator [soil metagenome]
MPKSTSSKKAEVTTGFLLWQAGNAWQRKVKSVLDPVGITHVQYLLLDSLKFLGAIKHPVSQVTLSRVAGTDVMMTSKVIRVLEKKKMVRRKSNKDDGRVFLLELTKEGSKSLAEAKKRLTKSEANFFSGLELNLEKFSKCLAEIAKD